MLPEEVRTRLVAAATTFDRRASGRRGYNPNALGLYLGRIDEVVAEVAAGKPLREAVVHGFNDRLREALLRAVGEPGTTLDEVRRADAGNARKLGF
jgi:hypothetical protein